MSNEFIDLSEDFTFTFEGDDSKYQEDELQSCHDKLDALTTQIQNLIKKLKMDPDKPMIKWPNRIKDIENFETKINKILKG